MLNDTVVKPRDDTFERIAPALQIDIAELLGGPLLEVSEMGSLIPGTRAMSVGVGSKGLALVKEPLEVLRQALALICTMELSGEAPPRLREDLAQLVSNLEGQQ